MWAEAVESSEELLPLRAQLVAGRGGGGGGGSGHIPEPGSRHSC